MRGTARFVFLVLFCGLFVVGGLADARTPKGSMILADGFAAPNAYDGPLPAFFESWCSDTEDGARCIPTVRLDVFDVKRERQLGAVYAWGKDFRSTAAGTLQFKEFILYELEDGQLYTLSQEGGHPGGAFADPSLVVPKQGDVGCWAEPKASLSAARASTAPPPGVLHAAEGRDDRRVLRLLRRAVLSFPGGGYPVG